MEGYQPRPKNVPYVNIYNSGYRNHPNFSLKENNNPIYAQKNHMHGQDLNQNMPQNKPNKSTLVDNLNAFIHMTREKQSKNNQRLYSLKVSIKSVEVQVGKITENL